MTTVILASHGELSKGMLHSANMIIGDITKEVVVYCLYPGENPEDFAKEMKEEISKGNSQYIIITDILGGSVYIALSQLTIYENVRIFSGMNLGLVLGVLMEKQKDIADEKAQIIVDDAKDGITCKKSIEKKEDEDF